MKSLLSRAAWLALLPLFTSLRADAGVGLTGEASSSGENVTVNVFADIQNAAVLSHRFTLFYETANLKVVSAQGNADAWYFYDGTRTLPAVQADPSQPGEVRFVGGKLDSRNPLAGVTGNHILLGSVVFGRNSSTTPTFKVGLGAAGNFASFVTTNGITLEALPGEVTFGRVTPDAADTDLDGLNDAWETKNFGSIRNAFYSDDPDHDGANNLAEQAAGTDPKDPNSSLHLQVSTKGGLVTISWPSVAGHTYSLEGASDLAKFTALQESIVATPPLNTIEYNEQDLGRWLFFRVSVQPSRPL